MITQATMTSQRRWAHQRPTASRNAFTVALLSGTKGASFSRHAPRRNPFEHADEWNAVLVTDSNERTVVLLSSTVDIHATRISTSRSDYGPRGALSVTMI